MLFYSSNKLSEYVLFDSINIYAIKQSLLAAERKYIIPFIGQTLYDKLDASFTDDTTDPTDADLKTLLEYCRRVVAPAGLVLYMPKSDVSISEQGMRRNEEENKKTAYAYQAFKVADAYIKEAEENLESLLLFLEQNAEKYPEWTTSDAYKQYTSLLIRTAREFKEYFPTNAPYRNYWAMRPKMQQTEILISNAIGDEVYADIKTRRDLNEKEKQLLFRVKTALAYMTVAASVPYLTLRNDGNGFTVVDISNPFSNESKNLSTAPDPDFVSTYLQKAVNDANEWIKRSKDYIIANANDITAYNPPTKVDDSKNVEGKRPDVLRGSYGFF